MQHIKSRKYKWVKTLTNSTLRPKYTSSSSEILEKWKSKRSIIIKKQSSTWFSTRAELYSRHVLTTILYIFTMDSLSNSWGFKKWIMQSKTLLFWIRKINWLPRILSVLFQFSKFLKKVMNLFTIITTMIREIFVLPHPMETNT